MINISIKYIGVYRRKQTMHGHVLPHNMLGFFVDGLVYSRLKLPWGQEHCLKNTGEAFLRFSPAGSISDFSMTDKRENWVIMFDGIQFNQDPKNKKNLSLDFGDERIVFPMYLTILPWMINGLRARFIEIKDMFNENTVTGKLAAHIQTLELFRLFLEPNLEQDHSPAGELRNMINKDNNYAMTIDEMCKKCGYSKDHLRLLFKQEFGLTPSEYRNQKKLDHFKELSTYTDYSVKEIAYTLGFFQSSRLSSFIKRHLNVTPLEYIRTNRIFN